MRKLLIIGKVWPEPKSSAAGTRMMQLIEFFQKENFEITFASAANFSEFQEDLSVHNVMQEQIVLNDSSFDVFLEKLNPDVVLFDRFMTEEQFGWRVIENCPDSYRILNTEDLHFLRKARHQSVKKYGNLSNVELLSEDAIREISSIYRCDLTLLVSNFEMELLSSEFQIPSDLLYYLPVFAKRLNGVPSFQNRHGFMFIGNYYHEPNWDALRVLKKEIWPLIREEMPSAILNVYGAYSGQKVNDFHNPKEGFIVHGRAEDAIAVTLKSRVSLVPLRFGAGIKGKLLEAMQSGTPSVTTLVGSEGMTKDRDWGGTVVDDVQQFARAAVALYEDQEVWEQSQSRGYDILNDQFNGEDYWDQFKAKLYFLIANTEVSRKRYFVQRMFQYQSLMSNRYLSKWIEAKNRC